MSWWGKYVGLPFSETGLDWNGVHCWGLVRLVYLTELGIALPAYGEVSALQLARIAKQMHAESQDWYEVEVPKPFDVVKMRWYCNSKVAHCGVMVSETELLHVEQVTDAVVVPLNHRNVKHRIAGLRRHRRMLCPG